MKTKLVFLAALLLLLLGVVILSYPVIKTASLRHSEREAIAEFERYRTEANQIVNTWNKEAEHQCPNEEHISSHEVLNTGRAFSNLWDTCTAYNQQLIINQSASYTSESIKYAPIDLAASGWAQEVFAYLSVPAANLEVPLYLGANSNNMDRGGAILGQTSLPIGGESTNCVIAGHRSWNGAVQFKDLDQLQLGDKVLITNPWETLQYEVIEIIIVSPDAGDEVMIHKGQDLLTVFTCTYPNTHRFMVICARVSKGGKKQWDPILLPLVAMP